MKNNLTVIIPTYNRKEKLLKTLQALEMQTCKQFSIVICDNHSNYDIYELINFFPDSFKNNIRIVINNINIGMAGNLCNIFTVISDGWIWTLSDDDNVEKDAIEKILFDINSNKTVGIILYTLCNVKKKYTINNLHEFIDLYSFLIKNTKNQDFTGDLMFLSNKVYNMSIISKFIQYAFEYANSNVPHLVIIISMLNYGQGSLFISNSGVVNYYKNEEEHWNFSQIIVGMKCLADIPYNLSSKEYYNLMEIVMLKYDIVITDYFRGHSLNYKNYLYNLYFEVYRHFLKGVPRIVFRIAIYCPADFVLYKVYRKYLLRKRGKNEE